MKERKRKYYSFPENISENVMNKWNHVSTLGKTERGDIEVWDINNLPDWYDHEKFLKCQKDAQKVAMW